MMNTKRLTVRSIDEEFKSLVKLGVGEFSEELGRVVYHYSRPGGGGIKIGELGFSYRGAESDCEIDYDDVIGADNFPTLFDIQDIASKNDVERVVCFDIVAGSRFRVSLPFLVYTVFQPFLMKHIKDV